MHNYHIPGLGPLSFQSCHCSYLARLLVNASCGEIAVTCWLGSFILVVFKCCCLRMGTDTPGSCQMQALEKLMKDLG